METVNLGTETDRKEVKIGANLELSVKQRLIQMLHDYMEIFAWSYEDMPGLDVDIVVHHLPTKEDCPPVKQKVRRMRPEMSEVKAIQEMPTPKTEKEVRGFLGRMNYIA